MRLVSLLLAGVLAVPLPCIVSAQDAAPKLNLVVVEGDGAINNIRQRTAREPIVQVEDENHRPIAGAVVVFTLSSQGASGTFAGGEHTLTVTSDAQGRAVARGLKPNNVQGQYQIRVNASYQGQTANTNISQSDAVAAGAATAAAGVSAKVIVLVVAAAAAAAVGGLFASGAIGGGGSTTSTVAAGPTLVTISPGTGTVGPPR